MLTLGWSCFPFQWLLLGMGIRVATDLNLHRKSQLSGKDTDESKARDREIINRERTWL